MSGINPVERWREDGIIKDDRDERIAALEKELRLLEAVVEAAEEVKDSFAALCRAVAQDENCSMILDRTEQNTNRGAGKKLTEALAALDAHRLRAQEKK